MTSKPKPLPLRGLFAQPNKLVARLILAELIAKRGKGPLARRVIGYRPIGR
jgi:hypothetical protein